MTKYKTKPGPLYKVVKLGNEWSYSIYEDGVVTHREPDNLQEVIISKLIRAMLESATKEYDECKK
jgi:hypothetical protein